MNVFELIKEGKVKSIGRGPNFDGAYYEAFKHKGRFYVMAHNSEGFMNITFNEIFENQLVEYVDLF